MNFAPPRDRDAWGTIRGFVYQVALTIDHWLRLEGDQVLELERGEDIDVITSAFSNGVMEEKRLLEQIKRLEGTITLNSPEAREALANFVEHRLHNPGTNLRFCFITTAAIARERQPRMPRDMTGIEEWENIAAGTSTSSNCLRPVAAIRRLLRNGAKPDKLPPDTWNSYQNYLKRSRLLDFFSLITSFRWSTGQAEPEEVRIGIERSLRKTGVAQNEGQAKEQYNALFVHVFHMLSLKGLKRLTPSERDDILSSGAALSNSDRKLLASLNARLDLVESEIAGMGAQISDIHGVVMAAGMPWDRGNSQAITRSTITHDFKPYIDRILEEGSPSLLPSPLQNAFNGHLSF
ncbi:MAG TPA: hypothetical protein PKA58_34460, partial [Polyangium sp.]|nr:hypothetical protein [Polyangium sp.]